MPFLRAVRPWPNSGRSEEILTCLRSPERWKRARPYRRGSTANASASRSTGLSFARHWIAKPANPASAKPSVASRPHLFSNVPVFLTASALEEMQRIVVAIEATAKLPAYRETVLSWAPEIAKRDFGPTGALMGYDFHLDDDGPKLIEVNTNAGGAFLNALLARAQKACCSEVEQGVDRHQGRSFRNQRHRDVRGRMAPPARHRIAAKDRDRRRSA